MWLCKIGRRYIPTELLPTVRCQNVEWKVKRMTRAEAIKMLTAKVECIKRYSSGINEDCNSPDCGECTLWYEQGNMGEQIEYLQMAIKTLEEPQWISCSDCERRCKKWEHSKILQE